MDLCLPWLSTFIYADYGRRVALSASILTVFLGVVTGTLHQTLHSFLGGKREVVKKCCTGT